MNVTLDDFCHKLLDDELFRERLDPEELAAAFVRCFDLSGRPSLNELNGLMNRAGFGMVSARPLDGLKGVHFGAPRGEYDIYYREDLWDGAKAHTVLHEAYEIIHETLCALHSDDPPERPRVPGGRPFRGGGVDAAGDLLRLRPGQRAGRGGPAGHVPVLLRLSCDASGRGDAPAASGCAAVRVQR